MYIMYIYYLFYGIYHILYLIYTEIKYSYSYIYKGRGHFVCSLYNLKPQNVHCPNYMCTYRERGSLPI